MRIKFQHLWPSLLLWNTLTRISTWPNAPNWTNTHTSIHHHLWIHKQSACCEDTYGSVWMHFTTSFSQSLVPSFHSQRTLLYCPQWEKCFKTFWGSLKMSKATEANKDLQLPLSQQLLLCLGFSERDSNRMLCLKNIVLDVGHLNQVSK